MDILETVKSRLAPFGVGSIGDSECGNPIYFAHKGGYGGRQIIITGGIHARECYTALAVLRQAETFDRRDCGVYFVPLVNPDGALFFERGETFGRELLQNSRDLRYNWKANANGVDLNTNFDAHWGTGVCNVRVPGASDFIGDAPLCARESAALAAFTLDVKPVMTVSYHSMGGELYWEFFQDGERRVRDERIALAASRHIGVKKVDGDLGSAGGYKDYCILKLGIPAITVELVKDGTHPLSAKDYAADIIANASLPDLLFSVLGDTELKYNGR